MAPPRTVPRRGTRPAPRGPGAAASADPRIAPAAPRAGRPGRGARGPCEAPRAVRAPAPRPPARPVPREPPHRVPAAPRRPARPGSPAARWWLFLRPSRAGSGRAGASSRAPGRVQRVGGPLLRVWAVPGRQNTGVIQLRSMVARAVRRRRKMVLDFWRDLGGPRCKKIATARACGTGTRSGTFCGSRGRAGRGARRRPPAAAARPPLAWRAAPTTPTPTLGPPRATPSDVQGAFQVPGAGAPRLPRARVPLEPAAPAPRARALPVRRLATRARPLAKNPIPRMKSCFTAGARRLWRRRAAATAAARRSGGARHHRTPRAPAGPQGAGCTRGGWRIRLQR
jgi:hypothetical protein